MKLTISVLISIIGIILLSTPPTVTGALIGTTTSVSFLSQILGLILITLSIATSMTNGLEIRVTDNIKESKILLKLAKDARKNAHVRSELTHLEAGLGRQGHIEDTGIFIYVGAMVEDYTLIELGKKVIKSLVNLEKEKIKTV